MQIQTVFKQTRDLLLQAFLIYIIFLPLIVLGAAAGSVVIPGMTLYEFFFKLKIGIFISFFSPAAWCVYIFSRTSHRKGDPERFSRSVHQTLFLPKNLNPKMIPSLLGIQLVRENWTAEVSIIEFCLNNDEIEPEMSVRTSYPRRITVQLEPVENGWHVKMRASPVHWYILGDPNELGFKNLNMICDKLLAAQGSS